MLEWKIKPLSKKSALTGRDIKPGDTVVCAVFTDGGGNLDRIDSHKDDFDDSKIEGRIIGRWEREVNGGSEADERELRRSALASSENFFVSLFDEKNAASDGETAVLKQILALLLERKRILRPVGRVSNGVQKYVQSSTKRKFDVPQADLGKDTLARIQKQLEGIII